MSNIRKPLLGELLDYGNPFTKGLTKGLVGLWLMNEGSGNTVQDLSGTGHVSTFNNAPTWTSGKYGSGIQFVSGSYQSIFFDDRNVDIQTIAVWAYLENSVTEQQIVSVYNAVTEGQPIQIRQAIIIDASNVMGGTIYAVDAYETIDTPFVAGWHMIVQTHDYSVASQRVYVDGVRVTGTTGSLGLTSSRQGITLGADMNAAADFFDGIISHCCVYNRALSASEIQQLYREPFCMFDRDPIELWSAAQGGGAPATTILPQITNAYMGI